MKNHGDNRGSLTEDGWEAYLLDLTRPYHNLLGMVRGEDEKSFYWDGNAAAMAEEKAGEGSHPVLHYYLQDELGSPVRVSGYDSGYLAYGYDEFGNDLYSDLEEAGIPSPYSRQGEEQPFGYTGYRYDEISGTYFAQAREYQPENGRFTAQDVIQGNGAVPETLNRYGYCWGNPVKYIDNNGENPITQREANEIIWNYFMNKVNSTYTAIETKAKNSINSIKDTVDNRIQSVKGDVMDKTNITVQITRFIAGSYNGTLSVGGNLSGTAGIWQHDGSLGISMDTKGNIGLQGTYVCGVTTGTPSWAVLVYRSESKLPDIYALEGDVINMGGSVNVPVNVIPIPIVLGGDINFANGGPYDGYCGDTVSVGVGFGNEVHVEWGGTTTFISFNVFDWWNDIYKNYKRNECEVME